MIPGSARTIVVRLIVLLAIGGIADAQDLVLGGITNLSAGLRGDIFSGGESSLFYTADVTPIVSVFGDTMELHSRFSVGVDDAGIPTASVDEIRIDLTPAGALTMRLGLFRPTAGGATLLSPVNYLGGLDLSGAVELEPVLDRATGIAAFSVLGDQLYVTTSVAPVPARDSILSAVTDLTALPYLEIVDDTSIPGSPLTRESAGAGPLVAVSDLERLSAVVEAGWTGPRSDIALFLYRGLDRIPSIGGVVDTTGPSPDGFDLTVQQFESPIYAIGGSIQSVLGPAMLWCDGSFAFNRRFGTTTIDPTFIEPGVWSTESVVAPALDLVAGGAVQLFDARTTLVAEYRHGFVFTGRDDLIRLDMAGTLLARLEVDFLDGALNLATTGLVLIPDRSGLASTSIEYSPGSEITVGVRAPVVVGGDDTILGSFRDLTSVDVYLSVRF